MTLSQLALNNVKASGLRYAAYFLSCVFTVTLFCVYAQFILHPEVASGYIYGGEASRVVLIVCEVLVTLFAFFFVLYSSGAFLRARSREFGLLSLLGTTRGQLRRLVWLESTLLSGMATVVGIALGLLLSRLFLMGISRVMDMPAPLRFAFVPGAVLLTLVVFLVLFQLVTLVATFRVGRRTIVALLGESRKPRITPRASLPLALVGALLIAGGYFVAAAVHGAAVIVAFVPVVAVVVVGTYLLFGHGSVRLLYWLQKREAAYLRGPRMLAIAQLVFKVRDNSRLMATIASLSAVVLVGAGVFHVFNREIERSIYESFPQSLSFLEPLPSAVGEAPETSGVDAAVVEGLLLRHSVTPTARGELRLAEGRMLVDGSEQAVILVGEAEYAGLLRDLGRRPVAVAVGDASAEIETLTARREEAPAQMMMTGRPVEPMGELSLPHEALGRWYQVPDAALAELIGSESGLRVRDLRLFDWERGPGASALVDDLLALGAVSAPGADVMAGRDLAGREVRRTLGLSFFVGLFVSLLFFVGAGSLIYFKLFTELPEDSRTLWRLRRIGLTPGETGSLITWQVATIFFLPFAVGAVHAAFALTALGNLLGIGVGGYTVSVLVLFAVVQLAFYLFTRWTYLRQLERLAIRG